jgi:CelD/BcsL family acetyltransferase involved in cellulose biosynthesis
VAALTYQRTLGVGFQDDERQRARIRMLMERGWFRSYILYLDGRPVAFEQGEAYGSRFVSVRAGYHPAHAHHRIGAYLLAKTIEDVVHDTRFSIFDFGLGDAEYKRKLAHRSIEEGDLAIFARRARPIRINIARTGVHGVSSGLRASLRKAALLDASKQWWRRNATRRSRRG